MVRRCAWGTCNADCRYPEKMIDVRFVTFPNPKTKLDKCLRWIKACGRPHDQLNIDRVNKNKVICSTHFLGGNGPTDSYPDPIPADGTHATPTRPPPKRRRIELTFAQETVLGEITENNNENLDINQHDEISMSCEVSCQTDTDLQESQSEQVSSLIRENKELRKMLHKKDCEIKELKASVKTYQRKIDLQQTFSAEGIRKREQDLKNVFVYYTGISYINFLFLFSFLFPNPEENMKYGRSDTKLLSNENALLLALCRLRHDFGLKDLAMRFSLSLQSTGIVFNKLLDLLYFKFGQISLWPHRDVIISTRGP